jgi:hypothetical protein
VLKYITKLVLFGLFAAAVPLVTVHSAFAQLPPAISPWMGMFDRNRGNGLDKYNQYVKPQQDYLKAYAAQQGQIQAQQQMLQQAMSGSGNGGGGGSRTLSSGGGHSFLKAPREIPSGSSGAANFNQYLHYYQGGLPRQPVPNFSSGRRR